VKRITVSRRNFFKWSLRGSFCFALGYPSIFATRTLSLETVDVPIVGLPPGLQGLKIGLLSDFHTGTWVEDAFIQTAVQRLGQQNPDLVLLGGDFADGNPEIFDPWAGSLAGLNAPLGTYAVLGNHDFGPDSRLLKDIIKRNGVRLLRNEAVNLKVSGDELVLVGLDDVIKRRANPRSALKGVSQETFKILLVHEPDYADRISNIDNWIPLQLSGHSHGGQASFPFIGRPFLPYLAQRYPAGLQKVHGTDRLIYTTRGVGQTIPFRINCQPEVTLLRLSQASPSIG